MNHKEAIRALLGVSSLILFLFGTTQVVLTWANHNLNTPQTWAFFANGLVCVLTGFAGCITAIKQGVTHAKIHFIMSVLTVFESIIVFIIYSRFLPNYIKNACGGTDLFNPYCQGIKIYLSAATSVFWSFILILIPISAYVSYRYLKNIIVDKPINVEMDKQN
ncbi:hypothetical protein DLAC_05982 [Tieghemostelium lacteum]|uniref:Transmembrane protein n=1 Tax=Tieghemostelium lacteum TaxID=361077 RepID=A0A151ZHH2_TIELA|nr:hypothetical protein DLAC_05982 [Tieghemostelium lacteum]|eukprot:KYQ93314.1 hypothetical protein DLAC_05982 [Tieghemostelium lacteum]